MLIRIADPNSSPTVRGSRRICVSSPCLRAIRTSPAAHSTAQAARSAVISTGLTPAWPSACM